jgi:hypothetical protein
VAAVSLADLLTGFAGGVAAIVGPIVGAALGLLSARKGASRLSAGAAVGLNALLLVTTIVAGFVFGGC